MTHSSSPLEGQIALVTGASRGIGQASAIALAKAGAHCILSARNQGGLMETDDYIRQQGQQSTLLPLDFSHLEEIDTIGPSIANRFGRLDILIHAGFQIPALMPLEQIPPMMWEKQLRTNLTGCWHLIRTISPILLQASMGHAVFLQTAQISTAFWSSFCAVQAAKQAMIQCWAEEIKRLSSLQVHLFYPSPTKTRMRKQLFPAENTESLATPPQIAEQILSLILPSSYTVPLRTAH